MKEKYTRNTDRHHFVIYNVEIKLIKRFTSVTHEYNTFVT